MPKTLFHFFNKVNKSADGLAPKLPNETSTKKFFRQDGQWAEIVDLIYPVGSIYTSVNNTSPETLFGGTWEAIEGKFLLSADTSHAAGTSGGSATKSIDVANLPSHTHSVGAHSHGLNGHTHSVGAHAHGLNSHTHGVGTYATADAGKHSHTLTLTYDWDMAHNGWSPTVNSLGTYQSTLAIKCAEAPNHKHTVTGASGAASGNTANSTAFDSGAATGDTANSTAFDSGSTGSGTALDVMPPYLSVYMWKRTA